MISGAFSKLIQSDTILRRFELSLGTIFITAIDLLLTTLQFPYRLKITKVNIQKLNNRKLVKIKMKIYIAYYLYIGNMSRGIHPFKLNAGFVSGRELIPIVFCLFILNLVNLIFGYIITRVIKLFGQCSFGSWAQLIKFILFGISKLEVLT